MKRKTHEDLTLVAEACRRGLMSLVERHGSPFEDFPVGACGVASDIVGRVIWEALGRKGVYVCGCGHSDLLRLATHAWFEVDDWIVDVTHDQFPRAGLNGWVFRRSSGWHAGFESLEPRGGFCGPENWPMYPHDGYGAALKEVRLAGLLGGDHQ